MVARLISTRYLNPMTSSVQISAHITRLARLDAADTWESDLNPVQIAALGYLSRANRFSRAPSHVAEYLGTTRGTMSQSLKALARKGYLSEHRSDTDKRSILYDLTDAGADLAGRTGDMIAAIDRLSDEEKSALQNGLSAVLTARLDMNGGRAFGICKDCLHHRVTADGAHCALLSLPLAPQEITQICHEQVPA